MQIAAVLPRRHGWVRTLPPSNRDFRGILVAASDSEEMTPRQEKMALNRYREKARKADIVLEVPPYWANSPHPYTAEKEQMRYK